MELACLFQAKWKKILLAVIWRLVESMPQRIAAVITACGGSTNCWWWINFVFDYFLVDSLFMVLLQFFCFHFHTLSKFVSLENDCSKLFLGQSIKTTLIIHLKFLKIHIHQHCCNYFNCMTLSILLSVAIELCVQID